MATRWYRAPELICSYFTRYSAAVDMWAAGCIFGELMKRKALFPGHNVYHQIDLITDFVGTPATHTISKVRNHKARDYLSSLPQKQRSDWASTMPMLDDAGIDLMSKMLAFDPDQRISAEAALDHPYFAAFHNTLDESLIPPPPLMLQEEFEWENEKRYTVADLRATLYGEICRYHPELEGAPGQVSDEQRARGHTNSTYGEHGTACADVKAQMQQLARGDKPTSRAASMPAPATEALVAQAAAATAATTAAAARTPPRVRSSGGAPEEQDAYSMYASYSQEEDMALDDADVVDAEAVDLPEEDLSVGTQQHIDMDHTDRKAESLSADDIRKLSSAAAETPQGRTYKTRQVSPTPPQELKKHRGETRRSKSPSRVRGLQPPPAPPLPPAPSKSYNSKRVMPPPPMASASVREKVGQIRRGHGGIGVDTEVPVDSQDEGCAIM